MEKTQTTSPHHLPTTAALAVVTYASALMLHEIGHALAGAAVGGTPTLISSTDLRGDWSSVSTPGFLLIGISGSLVNWILAGLGLILLRRKTPASAHLKFLAWLLLAVNGFMASVYMVVSPLLGFGDWATLLGRLSARWPLRLVTALVGGVLTLWWFRLSARWLACLVAGAGVEARLGTARALVASSWCTGGVLSIMAALFSPLGLAWAVPIAVGSTLGTTWPLLPAARSAAEQGCEEPVGLNGISRSWAWQLGAVAVGLVFVFGFGPGIRL